MEIIEGNKIIAEFLGFTVFNKRYPRNHGIGGGTLDMPKHCIAEKLKYHSCWKSIMVVMDEIESIGQKDFDEDYHFIITKRFVRVVYNWSVYSVDLPYISTFKESYKEYDYKEFGGKILSIWAGIIDFIKWYNSPIEKFEIQFPRGGERNIHSFLKKLGYEYNDVIRIGGAISKATYHLKLSDGTATKLENGDYIIYDPALKQFSKKTTQYPSLQDNG